MNSVSKIYFASDFHLGAPDSETSRLREKEIIAWMDQVCKDATEIFLVGDLFDFWFTYKKVVPRGFIRFQGKIAEIIDSGIPIHIFSGNHDLWGIEYFEKELGAIIHKEPIERTYNGKNFYIGHGDGLGPGDKTYKLLKKYIFLSPLTQWAFANFHTDLGIGLAQSWSGNSRSHGEVKDQWLGEEKEWLVQYSKEILKEKEVKGLEKIDYFIFGHRHLSLDIPLGNGSRYINLGEWFHKKSYAVLEGEELKLEFWSRP